MTKAETAARREEACNDLRKWLQPGDTVYTILRHRARSGMFRRISLTTPDRERPTEMLYLDGRAAQALGLRLSDKVEGLPASGCGMDMGFHLVYELSHRLWPNGYGCIGKGCPSNDHHNGDRDYTPDDSGDIRWTPGNRKYKAPHKHWHRDGGYGLRHRWL